MSIDVLGIPLYDKPLDSAVDELVKTCHYSEVKANRKVSATGAHGLVLAQKDGGFAKTLKSFYWNLPDGVPGVWIGRLKGSKSIKRCYGPDLFKQVMLATSGLPIKHYFCGGKEGIAEELAKTSARQFNNSHCVGTHSPPFRQLSEAEYQSLALDITNKQADIVWIGLSTPKQELFASALSNYIAVHYIITVGAAFDFHTGKVREAPRFIQNAGMEWFYRLLMEPRRLLRRYLVVVPLFLYYAAIDLVRSKLSLPDSMG